MAASYGWTPAGFVPKPLSAIVADLQTAFLTQIDPGLDLSPTSPEGQIIGVIANAAAEVWEALQVVHNAYDPQAAEGHDADNIGDLRGIPREGSSFTTILLDLTFSGAAGPFASGALVVGSTVTPGLTFANTAAVTASGAGTLTAVNFQAQAAGPTPTIAPGTITTILTPQTNWTGVTNDAGAATVGANAELDGPYLARQATELPVLGACNPAATAAALVALGAAQSPPVEVTATVVENLTNATITVGALSLPPHTYSPVIYEPTGIITAAQYAAVIWANKPDGIPTVGANTSTILDANLGAQAVFWTTPTPMPLFISMTVAIRAGFVFSSVVQNIRDALVAAAVQATPPGGQPPQGQLTPGAPVIGSQLVAVAMGAVGVADVQALTFGFSASPTNTAPLAVAPTSIATILGTTANTNIVITQGTFP